MPKTGTVVVPIDATWLERIDKNFALATSHLTQARELLLNTGKYREEAERGKKQLAYEHITRALELIAEAAAPF